MEHNEPCRESRLSLDLSTLEKELAAFYAQVGSSLTGAADCEHGPDRLAPSTLHQQQSCAACGISLPHDDVQPAAAGTAKMPVPAGPASRGDRCSPSVFVSAAAA